jgi:hypothetical protein
MLHTTMHRETCRHLAAVSEPLAGRSIVVGGSTGDIGVDIVAQLIEAGAEVLVPVRDERKASLPFPKTMPALIVFAKPSGAGGAAMARWPRSAPGFTGRRSRRCRRAIGIAWSPRP